MTPEEFFIKYTGVKPQEGAKYDYEFLMDFAACYEDFGTDVELVALVQDDLSERAALGKEKYGTTMDREDLTVEEWLQHAYEEVLDLSLYLKKLLS
jgi:hypothetical protein